MTKRVVGGLAWAGLLLVVAVPSADAITAVFIPKVTNRGAGALDVANLGETPELIAPIPATRSTMLPVVEEAAAPVVEDVPAAAIDQVVTASIDAAPAEEPATVAPTDVAAVDPVDAFIETGKDLPAYISGTAATGEVAAVAPTDAPAAEVVVPVTDVAAVDTDVPVTTPDPGVDPLEVASLGAGVVEVAPLEAPIPMPLEMRPTTTQVSFRQNEDVVLPTDDVVLPNDDALLPPADVRRETDVASTRVITQDELDGWESGSLADYLEREGLVEDDSNVVIRRHSSEFEDADFERTPRHRNQRVLIGPVDGDDEDGFFPFFD